MIEAVEIKLIEYGNLIEQVLAIINRILDSNNGYYRNTIYSAYLADRHVLSIDEDASIDRQALNEKLKQLKENIINTELVLENHFFKLTERCKLIMQQLIKLVECPIDIIDLYNQLENLNKQSVETSKLKDLKSENLSCINQLVEKILSLPLSLLDEQSVNLVAELKIANDGIKKQQIILTVHQNDLSAYEARSVNYALDSYLLFNKSHYAGATSNRTPVGIEINLILDWFLTNLENKWQTNTLLDNNEKIALATCYLYEAINREAAAVQKALNSKAKLPTVKEALLQQHDSAYSCYADKNPMKKLDIEKMHIVSAIINSEFFQNELIQYNETIIRILDQVFYKEFKKIIELLGETAVLIKNFILAVPELFEVYDNHPLRNKEFTQMIPVTLINYAAFLDSKNIVKSKAGFFQLHNQASRDAIHKKLKEIKTNPNYCKNQKN